MNRNLEAVERLGMSSGGTSPNNGSQLQYCDERFADLAFAVTSHLCAVATRPLVAPLNNPDRYTSPSIPHDTQP